jgi:endonuclease YncB( thermonuclease family)
VTRLTKIARDAVFLAAFLLLGSLIIAKLDLQEGVGLAGPFYAIDGDTLAAGIERLRLAGIDAPEAEQVCRTTDGRDWACGEDARAMLAGMVGTSATTCSGDRRDRYDRILVTCRNGGTDLNAELVRQGMAVASGDYRSEESAARDDARGIWAGPFETPRAWRASRGEMESEEGWQALWNWLRELVP